MGLEYYPAVRRFLKCGRNMLESEHYKEDMK